MNSHRNNFTPTMSIQNYDALRGEEVLAKRSRFGKVFSLGGNRFQAVTYSEPVHHFDHAKQEWVEIDNTFKMPEKVRQVMTQWDKTARLEADQRKLLASEPILEAHGGDMNVSCGIAGSAPFIVLTDEQNHKLSWGIEGAESILPLNNDDSFQAEKSTAPINIREHRERIVRQTNGSIEYTDIFPGVDLCCHLGRRFKDDITFKAQESVRPITFNLAIDPTHTIRANADHSFDVVNTSNETVFHLPTPFLMDAAGHFGTVNVELEQTDDNYRMVCTPDPKYMAAAVYPVILDPAVETAQQDSAIEDTYVIQNSTANNSTDTKLHVVRNTSSGDRHIYMRVKTLPPLGSNHFITKAYMCVKPLTRPTADTRLMAREVLGNWSESTITYANQPAYNNLWQDYCTVRANTSDWCQLDVTSLARKWYLGTNYGIMFPPAIEYPTELYLHSTANSSPPYFVVNYASLAGLESYLAYDQQSVGRAGTGYIGLLNGNLVFEHSDTSMNGLRMPVSVTHYYNSCDANKNEFGMGYGWRTSLHQTLHKEYLSGTVYFVYTDGDGTEHYFEGSGNSFSDMSGLSLSLSVGSSNITITDKGNNVMTFPLVSGTPTASNPATAKVLITTLRNSVGNSISIASSSLRISTVTDGAGRVTTFVYSSNLCSAIYTPWQTASTGLRFTYTSGQLTKATYEDNRTSTFSYATSGSYRLLLTATGPESIKVTYTYANRNATDGLPHTVTKAVVTGGSLTGTNTSYEYGNHLTRVIDNLSGKALRYHFNDNGNEVSIDDELGYAVYTRYDQSGSNSSAPINHATLRSRMQKVVHNLLVDSSFENASSVWKGSTNGTFTRDQSTCQWGLVSMKVTTSSTSTVTYRQTVTLTPGKSYTLSGYAKSDAPLACVRIGYTVDDTTTYLRSDPVPIGTSDGFKRISVSFTLPSNASSSVTAAAIAYNAVGNAWFDCLQLEEGLTCNHYNLLHNSNFVMTAEGNHLPDRWSVPTGTSLNYISHQPLSSCTVTPPSFLTGRAIHLTGRYDRDMSFYQDFRAYGNAGDTFSAGGWCSCFAKETDDDNYVHCRINVLFTGDGTNYATGGSIVWNYEEGNWQFASGSIVAPHQYIAIRFLVQYSCQVNHADVTGFYIYPERFGSEYVYDANGNAKSAKTLFGKTEKATYDSFNNMISYTAPGKSVSTTYDYGSTDAAKKKHLLLSSITPLGTKTTNTYNSHGNLTAVNISDNSGGTTAFIKTTNAYSSDGNYVFKQVDARGKTVTTVTDANQGTVTSVTDPNSQKVSYTYDTLRRPTKVTTTADSKEYKNEYAYNATTGYLTTIKHNTSSSTSGDVSYTFAYDALGRPTTVKVGSTTLSTNTYNSTGTLAKTTFGNGGVIANVYDSWKRLTGVKYDGDSSPRYTYSYNANGQVAHVKDTALNRVTETEYDLANRPCLKKIHDGTSHVYTGELAYNTANGNLSKFAERVGTGHTAYQTTFGYDNENRPTSLTYGSYGKTTNGFDKLGRVKSRGLAVGSGSARGATYTYLAGGHGTDSTTGLVQKITQYGTTLTYAYDNVGNIISVADGSKTVSYVYDKLGQLTRANDPYDTTAGSTGTTWVYAYDQGGNITQKVAYAYTTGTVGTAVQTIPYTYGDSNWKDKLTAYNGTTISYDAIGNPTSDGTWTYTWAKGRQLQKMTKSGETATFTYNADGLRVKKVCTTTGTTKYILHGKNIVHLTNGSNNLHFFYDAQNRPAIVVYNGTAYGYVHNLQGDIIAIVDSAGTKVVEYKYDAWGKPLSKTGSMASTLGKWNPFRYRGYVYDEETNLYYLRSRYFNPSSCRFISADAIIGKVCSKFNGSLYCYCNNCPILLFDPNGYSGIWSLKSDTAGRTILLWWLFARGTSFIAHNGYYGDYMKKNAILTQKVKDIVLPMGRDLTPSESVEVDSCTSMEIENGEDIIGYQYLHGTNADVGGFKIHGTISKNASGDTVYSLTYEWNDMIDPNFKYDSDKAKVEFADRWLPFAEHTDYYIRISWDDTTVIRANPGWFNWNSGWLQ